tara:strand:- start:8337 stop:9116 length:780 start_codon:yes stop_codon:yes gene_type:complete
MLVKDQMGRQFELPKKPTKIISLVPSQTELLVDLGLEDSIVGVTKFCVHPKHLRLSKKVVGGTKNISLDTIKALQPDIVLCNKEENTKEIVEALEKIFPVHVSDIYNLDDAQELIMQYGSLFDRFMRASKIGSIITKEATSFQEFIKEKPKKSVAYFIWKDPWMTVGHATFIDYLLSVNNFTNVFGNQTRYPELSLKDIQDKSPEVILLSSEPYPFKEKHRETLKKLIPNAKIILVDGEYFSWYGSRLQYAFSYFRSLH